MGHINYSKSSHGVTAPRFSSLCILSSTFFSMTILHHRPSWGDLFRPSTAPGPILPPPSRRAPSLERSTRPHLCHGRRSSHGAAAGHLRPAAGHRKTTLRGARRAHRLLWRPWDEAAAAGGRVQGIRGEGQDEGVTQPESQVVQAQVLRHLEVLTTVVGTVFLLFLEGNRLLWLNSSGCRCQFMGWSRIRVTTIFVPVGCLYFKDLFFSRGYRMQRLSFLFPDKYVHAS